MFVTDGKQTSTDRPPQRAKQDTNADSPLHDACKKGNLTRVRDILSQGVYDVDRRDKKHGRTILMVAAKNGHSQILEFLLRKGANVSQVDNNGDSALHWACSRGHVDIVKHLLSQHNVDIDSRGQFGRTSLMTALFRGHREVADVLVRRGANVSIVDDNGDSILHSACRGGHVCMVRYVLSHCSVDINSRSKSGKTPLMTTVYYGHREIFDVLVGMGANMSHLDDDGDNILHYASKGGHVSMVKYVLSNCSVDINSRTKFGKTPLMTTVYHGHRVVADVLVGLGANVSLVDANGDSVLHAACRGGHMNLVKYVLSSYRTDVNSRSKSGKTPLMTTVYYGHREIFDVLLGMGANVSHVNNDGDNILHYVCRGGHVSMARYLLSTCSVDINSRSKVGKTPLMTTVYYGYRELFDVLVGLGANVSHVDDDSDNVLHYTCRGGHVGMVKHLLSNYSVDINSRGVCGRTPLMTAVYHGHIDMFMYLLSLGANVSDVDDHGDNILHRASIGGHAKMVQHIISQNIVDINCRGRYGRTPLLRAAFYGKRGAFNVLVSNGCRNDLVDDDGLTILHLACLGGHVEMVQYILSQRMADINATNKDGDTAAILAKRKGQHACYQCLVSRHG
ncbi:ankyrin repeat domain-containing protein 50-like [Haliotis asinina]|uniref:ankyrin repeat domain-containing protein 50-like n=1 Tax=Haliotis asinina TaxID=109174 RepID=UPI0035321466